MGHVQGLLAGEAPAAALSSANAMGAFVATQVCAEDLLCADVPWSVREREYERVGQGLLSHTTVPFAVARPRCLRCATRLNSADMVTDEG